MECQILLSQTRNLAHILQGLLRESQGPQCVIITLCRCFTKPFGCSLQVSRHSVRPHGVPFAQCVLRFLPPLLCGPKIPREGLQLVFYGTIALFKTTSKMILSSTVTRIGRRFVPNGSPSKSRANSDSEFNYSRVLSVCRVDLV